MRKNKTESAPVAKDTFDAFRNSKWPSLFGGTAHHSNVNKIALSKCITGLESAVALSAMDERDMLEEMGIIQQEPRPEQPDDFRDFRFTQLGREVVASCEGLYTHEEYEQRNAEARVVLDQIMRERADRLGL